MRLRKRLLEILDAAERFHGKVIFHGGHAQTAAAIRELTEKKIALSADGARTTSIPMSSSAKRL
jgi:nanoRNase/pAp phosphatase (c-di-AMP/oligoRNAs hydrolase)